LVTGAPSASTPAALLQIATVPAIGARSLTEAVAVSPVIFAGGAMGSGFLISRDGYLITNQHVVGDAQYVKVRWPDGSEGLGEVIRSDRRRDVALVKADPHGRQPLVLNQALPAVGDTVFAVGAPLQESLQGTVTKGIVSAVRTEKSQRFIQSDVSINHGNSGGPLLNEKGAVLGLTVSGIQLGEAPAGINFFIPISDALEALAITSVPVTAAR
jgi:S1-C subfamily serine protease